jgi:hypothetical protein
MIQHIIIKTQEQNVSKPAFCFMDESGVLAEDPSQPYFALGFLFIEDTSKLVETLSELKAQARQNIQPGGCDFEFKFKRVTYRTVQYFEKLIDIVLSHPARIVVFFLDKTDSRITPSRYFKGSWDAYIGYSKLVIKSKIKSGKECVVIGDYLLRPKASGRYFEQEIGSLKQVVNATMLESHACILIQAVDVLMGCVCYQFKRKGKVVQSKGGKVKMKLSKYLARKLGRKSLADSFALTGDINFEVWKFEPK